MCYCSCEKELPFSLSVHPVSPSVTERRKVTLEPGLKRVKATCTSTKWLHRFFIVRPMTSCFYRRIACSWFPHVHMQVFGAVFLFCVCVCACVCVCVGGLKQQEALIYHCAQRPLKPCPSWTLSPGRSACATLINFQRRPSIMQLRINKTGVTRWPGNYLICCLVNDWFI